MDLFSYPHTPGAKQRETSFEAAAHVAPDASRLRRMALDALKRGPMTADEVAAWLGLDRLSIRPRLTELSKLGKIIETGTRRKNASGRSAMVWAAL